MAGVSAPLIGPPNTMGQTFDLLAQTGFITQDLVSSMKKAVGFRNIAVHNDDAVNWDIVYRIAKNHLSDFSEFAKMVAVRLDGR